MREFLGRGVISQEAENPSLRSYVLLLSFPAVFSPSAVDWSLINLSLFLVSLGSGGETVLVV